MFDYESLKVFEKAREANRQVLLYLLRHRRIDFFIQDQLKRAAISVIINIAEGTAYITKASRRKFYIIARASVHECSSLLFVLKDSYTINQEEYDELYLVFEEISKMLLAMIKRTL